MSGGERVIVFVRSDPRCKALSELLVKENFPTLAIHSAMPPAERLSKYQQFKNFCSRILVATELVERGIDFEKVSIVINFDAPKDSDTYLHRVARTGRFGRKGLAITFVGGDSDAKVLKEVQNRFHAVITALPEQILISSYM